MNDAAHDALFLARSGLIAPGRSQPHRLWHFQAPWSLSRRRREGKSHVDRSQVGINTHEMQL